MRAITAPAEIAALVAKERAEEARITIWLLLPTQVRRLVLAFAEMPRERAEDDLTKFTRNERARITSALQSMMVHLSMAEGCMRDTEPRTTVLH